MDISKSLKETRATLGESSIKTYTSVLRSLHRKVFGDDEVSMDNFKNTEKIMDFLKDMPANRRKTILSALVVLTGEEKYKKNMAEDVTTYNHEIAKQQTTPAQDAAWVDKSQLDAIFLGLKQTAEMLYKKAHLTPSDLQHIQDYIMLACMGGFFIPPRRSLDYCLFKIKGVDKTKDNYLDKSSFVFNTYKTAKTYGKQVVEIPKELKTILNKWMKMNPTEHLLFDTNMNPLNSVKVNQRLGKIFKSISTGTSVNALRHSFLTTKYGETIKQKKEIEKDMSEMGSSANMITTYVKHLDK